MILELYAGIGFFAVALILFFRSNMMMNAVSTMNALAHLILSGYVMLSLKMPTYYGDNRFFFIDHLGIYEVIIISIIFFFSAVYSKGYLEGSIRIGELSQSNVRLYYVMVNLLLSSMAFVFFANNLALFWILAELTTVFSALLIVTLNAKKNIGAALKYVFITSSCMLFSFIGLIFLFALSEHGLGYGTLNWDVLMSNAALLPPKILFAAFALTFVGYASKTGVVPFHGWLPTAHSKALAPTSAILSGCVTSIGLYGILRMYAIVNNTVAQTHASWLLIIFGLLSISVAAFNMFSQKNLKKLIGFSTIENMGIMLVGIGVGTPIAVFWVLFHVLAHSLTKGLLFLSAGIIHHQYESVRIENIRNLYKLQPLASLGLLAGCLAIIGMPPFAIFLSKLFILTEVVKTTSYAMLAIVLLLLFVASSAYVTFFITMFLQIDDEKTANRMEKYRADMGLKVTIIALTAIVFFIGIAFPQYLNDVLTIIVKELGFM